MDSEVIVSSRPDRELRKKLLSPGDYTIVPYEESRCTVRISDLRCTNEEGNCKIEKESIVFSPSFGGYLLIGDTDCFIDKDFELILQQMCCGEVSLATMTYKNNEGKLVKEITCKIELLDVMEEQLISDWSWERLYEASIYHKEKGVDLVKQKRLFDAFRRFNKALKMLVAIEPIDPEVIDEDKVKEMIEVKVKLYNNLAHIQLQFNEYKATLDLCNRTLKYDPENMKALYRRSVAYSGLSMYEEAWSDIQHVLKIDPHDKLALQRANMLRPKIEKINTEYTNVIKKMFVSETKSNLQK